MEGKKLRNILNVGRSTNSIILFSTRKLTHFNGIWQHLNAIAAFFFPGGEISSSLVWPL